MSRKDIYLFSGYASVFNNIDRNSDVIVKGAFVSDLKNKSISKIPMLWQHKQSEPIGLWKKIYEDNYGLKVEGAINLHVQRGREIAELIKDGGISGISIGYGIIKQRKGYYENREVRILYEVFLYEISLVSLPMNEQARIDFYK